ncbi:MAG: glycine zipper 2TM domain-containing protein [Caulobacterales bacterium]|nr:glycine zipper 2TM domain-containing protein [Caulobacterales bacterium]
MRKTLTYAGLAALIALPLVAGPTDASASCQSRKTTGTILGGVGGALIGNSISHGGGGAVIGGLGGAVVGHQIGKSGCRHVAYYRTSHTRYSHNDRYGHPTRKVYYDQYGNPVGSEPAYARR